MPSRIRTSGKCETEKECSTCKETKPYAAFYSDPRNRDGFFTECIECNITRSTKWQQGNPDKVAHYKRKKRYGLSSDEYAAMLENQGNKCDICKTTFADTKEAHVDHDHATGKVRGVLCRNCNTGIGLLRDSTLTLTNAIEYLNKHNHE